MLFATLFLGFQFLKLLSGWERQNMASSALLAYSDVVFTYPGIVVFKGLTETP